jgi:hypothetical protein
MGLKRARVSDEKRRSRSESKEMAKIFQFEEKRKERCEM